MGWHGIADSSATVVNELFNKNGNPKYKYYYTDANSVAAGMKAAAEHFEKADL